jgi:hypothetical protein
MSLDRDNPYKGQDSYQVEDATLFFGREREAAQLTARIQGTRLTVLYAPSGAGKTSLLNARIIPALEAHGWLPVRSRPGDDPVDSLRRDTLHSLFPPLESELAALDNTMAELKLRNEDTIETLLEAFDSCPIAGAQHRRLLSPVANATAVPAESRRRVRFESAEGIMPPFEYATPYLCRVLRKTVEPIGLSDHFGALRSAGLGARRPDEDLSLTTPLGRLRSILSDSQLHSAYRAIVSWLHASPAGLRPFYENLTATYGAARSCFGLVLLLDQFEEVFTRFAGRPRATRIRQSSGASQSLDWHLREHLFDEIQKIYVSSSSSSQRKAVELPIRYVFSLREEYLARLGRLRRFVPELESSLYRLAWLSMDEAKEAIVGPITRRDYRILPSCVNAIVSGLALEEDSVEPGPLQIVCFRMWENFQKQEGAANGTSAIDERCLGGGVDELLRASFGEFLHDPGRPDTPALTPFDVLEILDILSPLITFSGTRNIVERKRLVEVENRNWANRARLLDRLEKRRIVRRERKLDGDYYEITHEFLIEPILDELTRNADYARVERALRALQARMEGSIHEALPVSLFKTLNQYRMLLRWSDAGNELMFRNAVFHHAAPEILRDWAVRYSTSHASLETLFTSSGFEGTRLLSATELRALLPKLELVDTEEKAVRVARSLIVSREELDRNTFLTIARKIGPQP